MVAFLSTTLVRERLASDCFGTIEFSKTFALLGGRPSLLITKSILRFGKDLFPAKMFDSVPGAMSSKFENARKEYELFFRCRSANSLLSISATVFIGTGYISWSRVVKQVFLQQSVAKILATGLQIKT
jgi:hypothetical protein